MIYFFLILAVITGIWEGLSKIHTARNNSPIRVTNNLLTYLTDTRY